MNINEALSPLENAAQNACEARFDLRGAENALTQAFANLEAAKAEREAVSFVLKMLETTEAGSIAVRNQWGLITPYTLVRCNRHVGVCGAAVETAKVNVQKAGKHFGEMMFTAGQRFGELNTDHSVEGS